MLRGHGCKFHRLVHAAGAPLLEEGVYRRVARRVGIARSTLYRWTKEPEFLRPLRSDAPRPAQG
jgi:hypothetical protein